jgi:hypothetical protein
LSPPTRPSPVQGQEVRFWDRFWSETLAFRLASARLLAAQQFVFNELLGIRSNGEMSVAQTDRDILFSNEAFVVGRLQASGGALVAAQSENPAFLFFPTLLAIALPAAVLAAHWKHQSTLWM